MTDRGGPITTSGRSDAPRGSRQDGAASAWTGNESLTLLLSFEPRREWAPGGPALDWVQPRGHGVRPSTGHERCSATSVRSLAYRPVQLGILLTAALVACHSSPAAPTPAAAAGGGGGASTAPQFRVVTWNLHHGYTADNRHVNQEQIAFLASLRPDVVALQELAEWDNDMPTIYRDGLRSATGVTWAWRYEADLPAAPKSKRDGSSVGSRLNVVSQDVVRLDDPSAPNDNNRNRSGIRFSIDFSGTRVDVATTHLDFSDASDRRSQLDRLQAWLAAGSAARIVAGDFNAEPGDTATWPGWQAEYADAWLSSGNPQRGSPGYTMPLRSVTGRPGRIDYQWFRGGVTPVHVEVVQTDLSDHYALVVDYAVTRGK